MSKYLVVVESPAKASTIKKFLGNNYKIKASMGHIRDLPKSRMGVDLDNDFEPQYINIRGKGDLINELKKEAKDADKVFLATDPDREGEAISWHLAHLFGIKDAEKCRITFNEITKNAVKNAIKAPREINMSLVDAQQARRVLDRIVGYKISPILWKKVKKGLSAGRVQSVATKMICDRENDIESFIPEEYWKIDAVFSKANTTKKFNAKFYGSSEDKKIELKNKEQVDSILNAIKGKDYSITKVKKGEKKRSPAPPFTTSTLQQEAARKLGYTTKKTMMLAQQLYEGVNIKGEGSVGLVSYIRTDSTRISDEAQGEAKLYITQHYGEKYLPESPRVFKNKSKSQDAHEAIRPTHVEFEPETLKESLSRDLFRLYKLIWERFISSQMSNAIYDTINVDIRVADYLFKASGSQIKFKGFTAIYVEGKDEGDKEWTDEPEVTIDNMPALEAGEKVKKEKLDAIQNFTQPPSRYTEATLVRALEEKGIGRPSTYSPTISTIISRGYIDKEKKQLYPTELGKLVNEIITKHFDEIVNVHFTAELETKLDEIEEGSIEWKRILKEFYGSFEGVLEKAEKEIGNVELPVIVSDVICEKCGRNMVIKTGRYGKFLACPGFPECRNAKPIVDEAGVDCPKCGHKVLVRKTKKGKPYLGCEKYPECDYMTWDKASDKKCEKCGNFMTLKYKGKMVEYKCSSEACGHSFEEERKRQNDKDNDMEDED